MERIEQRSMAELFPDIDAIPENMLLPEPLFQEQLLVSITPLAEPDKPAYLASGARILSLSAVERILRREPCQHRWSHAQRASFLPSRL